jgi:hypothetical protein
VVIEHALYGSEGPGGYHFLARSVAFRDEWLPEAERLCTGFGERPAGVACPGCVFAQPFGAKHVAVVQVADQGTDDAGRPGALGFYLLVLPRHLYANLGGDPFFLAERFPAPWAARGELPALDATTLAPLPRTLEDARAALDVQQRATLLGGVQALLDGGRLVFERTEPAPSLIRSLWTLLPNSTRCELWPATFAFGNRHGFHVVAVPRADGPDYANYLTEEQAGDYPEGRYELALQAALESGDRAELKRLFARRSRAQMFRLGLIILAGFILVPLAANLFVGKPDTPAKPPPAAKLELPRVEECPEPDGQERERLAKRLQELGHRRKVELPDGSDASTLTNALRKLDEHLGMPDRARDPGPLDKLGPLQRQVRALLWKHAVPGYNERGLNMCELLDKLETKLTEKTQ